MTHKLAMMGLLAVALFLAGCATPYQPYSSSNMLGGYHDAKIQDDIFSVSFQGNAAIKPEAAADYALLRAAELTLEQGCKYFAIISNKDASNRGIGVAGDYLYTYTMPSTNMMIKLFKTKPQIAGTVFDAAQVSNNIRNKWEGLRK